MHNQRLVLIALFALLMLGGATVAYYFVTAGSDPARNGLDRSASKGNAGADDDTDPAGTKPGKNSNAAANEQNNTDPNKADPGKSDPNKSDPARTNPNDPNKGVTGPGNPKVDPGQGRKTDPTDPTVPLPEPDMSDWVERVSEHTITGRIVYKSDGRPAAGAAITAEANRNEWAMGGDRGALPRAGDPQSKVEGSTVADGAGEFTLNIKLTRKVPPNRGDDGRARDITPEETDEEEAAGRGWTRWGGTEYVQVVGRMAGYAPARSGALYIGDVTRNLTVSLSLAIPAALSGRVVDAISRAGIAGASVAVYQADSGMDGWSSPRHASTDNDGYFTVNELGAGMYTYSASAEGYTAETGWRNGRRADLSKGGETDVGEIPLLPSGDVTGKVLDLETGKPIANAAIELETGSGFGRWSQFSGTSDAEGTFHIKGVAAGQFTLKVSAAGYAPVSRPGLVAESAKTTDAGEIRLGRGFKLEGTVVDAQGKGVAGAVVTVAQRGTATGFGWEAPGGILGSATTASNGSFSIGGMVEGPARVSVVAENFASLRHDLELQPGMGPLTLKLQAGARIVGRILAADGRPANGAVAGLVSHTDPAYQIHKAQPGQMQWFGDTGITTGTADTGIFELKNVPSGTYLFLCFPGVGRGLSVDNVRVNETDIDLGDLSLPGPGTLRVTVTDGGEPVAGLRVEARAGLGGWSTGADSSHPGADTDSSGVALIENVPAGDVYVMTARDKDNADTDVFLKRRVTVTPGKTTEFRIEFKSPDAARIHGRATINNKPHFTEVMLLGTGDKASFFKQTKPDEAGFYELNNVSAGTYVLHFRVADKIMSCLATVTVDKPGDLEVTRDFSAYVVSGKVSTPSNTPAERASVKVSLLRLNDPSPPQFAQWLKAECNCNADGAYRLEHVPAGSYRVTASLEGVGSVTQDITVTAGDLGGVNLEVVNNSGRLRVTIKKLNGVPLSQINYGMAQLRDASGAMLAFEDQSAGFFMAMAGSAVELSSVPAGTYTLVMSSAGCLLIEKPGVVITKGEQTVVEVEMTAAAELHLTVTNAEINQEMLDSAQVKFYDAQGTEIVRHVSPFDMWGGGTVPERPTLVARYIGPGVTQVKVKVPGYLEVTIAVEFEQGRKIEKSESLTAG